MRRRAGLRWSVVGGLLLATATLGLGTSMSTAATPAPASVLRVGMTSGINNPNLWALNSVAEFEAVTLQYDMMLKFSDKDLSAAPALADACDPSDGYRIWTCHIKSGVKWSDGVPLTSKDIAFTYRFIQKVGFPYFRNYFPGDPTFSTPDDTTLIWRTKEPTNAPLVPAWAYIVPEHVWKKYWNDDLKTVKAVDPLPNVVSGPYYMSKATAGQSWTFTRNPYFWGPRPAYDTIEFQLFTNQEAMVQALKNGQIDIADELDAPLLPALEKLDNVAVQKVTSDWWINLAFNFGGQDPNSHPLPALQDHRVREAIAMAINKQAIIDKVYPDAAVPGDTVIRPLSAYWHLDIPPDQLIPYDPVQANQILDDAGYTRGSNGVRVDPKTGQPLVIRLPVSNDTAGSQADGQLIAGYLKNIGITVNVQPVTAGKMYDIQQSGDFDAYIWYWSGDPDPNYQLSVFTSGECGSLSDGCWRDPKYDALYAEQRATLDPAKRQVIVRQAQQYIYDQIPVIVLAYPNAIEAYRTDKVTDLTPVPGANGYLTPQYSYTSYVTARPAAGNTASPSSAGLPTWAWILGIVGLIVFASYRYHRSGISSDEQD
jgi:peptide/nickel transport system substrate-binding protein